MYIFSRAFAGFKQPNDMKLIQHFDDNKEDSHGMFNMFLKRWQDK